MEAREASTEAAIVKLIVAGGRDYIWSAADIERLDALHAVNDVSEVVSGGARGADAFGELWAKRRGVPVRVFPADWATYGRAAGMFRNRQMAAYADAVVLFPGGKGTASMASEAKRLGLRIFDWRNLVVNLGVTC